MFIGFFILLLGLFMLLDRMGVISGTFSDIIVPIVLVALGASMIFKHKLKKD